VTLFAFVTNFSAYECF